MATLRFSQRIGIVPIRTAFQIENMDDPLRNSLWNIVKAKITRLDNPSGIATSAHHNFKNLAMALWHSFFKEPTDTICYAYDEAIGDLRNRYFNLNWYEVYDFIEFVASQFKGADNTRFKESCNYVLERELSGYRFVGEEIAPITNPAELAAIEEALKASDRLAPVNQHLETALAMLSDRTNPDYRNSVKESVSAVEAICQRITGIPKATLGDAVKELRKSFPVHPAFEGALHKLYGYTSDANGIRHALLEDEKLTLTDAKFMLVLSAGFVAYLIGKASEVGHKV